MRFLLTLAALVSSIQFIGANLSGAGANTASPSIGDEKMNCKFQRLDRDGRRYPSDANIQVSNDVLTWFEPVVLARPETGAGYQGLKYKILERNEVGMVAVRSNAFNEADVGAVLNAIVLTIRKSDGALRVGSTGVAGARDLISGTCT